MMKSPWRSKSQPRRPLPSGPDRVWDRAARILGWDDPNGPNRAQQFYRTAFDYLGKIRVAMHYCSPGMLVGFDEGVARMRGHELGTDGDLATALLRSADEDAESDVARAYLLADRDHTASELRAFIRETRESIGAMSLALGIARAKLALLAAQPSLTDTHLAEAEGATSAADSGARTWPGHSRAASSPMQPPAGGDANSSGAA